MHEFLHSNNNFRVQNAPKTAPSVRKVYEQNTSDNSDYGELRAIVKRIENESSQSDFQVKQEAEKKLVFDYVPASGMMKR